MQIYIYFIYQGDIDFNEIFFSEREQPGAVNKGPNIALRAAPRAADEHVFLFVFFFPFFFSLRGTLHVPVLLAKALTRQTNDVATSGMLGWTHRATAPEDECSSAEIRLDGSNERRKKTCPHFLPRPALSLSFLLSLSPPSLLSSPLFSPSPDSCEILSRPSEGASTFLSHMVRSGKLVPLSTSRAGTPSLKGDKRLSRKSNSWDRSNADRGNLPSLSRRHLAWPLRLGRRRFRRRFASVSLAPRLDASVETRYI